MIAKTKAKFPFKVFMKCFAQNNYFQESGWLVCTGRSPDYWTNGSVMRAFCENFNMS